MTELELDLKWYGLANPTHLLVQYLDFGESIFGLRSPNFASQRNTVFLI